MLDDLRYEIARQLLVDTALSLPEIAKATGYGTTSAFVRSFKRWADVTPAQWRQHAPSRGRRRDMDLG